MTCQCYQTQEQASTLGWPNPLLLHCPVGKLQHQNMELVRSHRITKESDPEFKFGIIYLKDLYTSMGGACTTVQLDCRRNVVFLK